MTDKVPRAGKRKTSRSATQPPARAMVEEVSVPVISSGDLRRLSQQIGFPVSHEQALVDASEKINKALYETCHLKMLEEVGGSARRAQWCHSVMSSAEILADLLTSTRKDDGWAPYDALELLKPGLQSDNPDSTSDLGHLLARAAFFRPERDLEGQFLGTLAQLLPSLRTLAFVATRAGSFWAERIERGGKTSDGARHYLIAGLYDAYVAIYGTAPTISTVHNPDSNRAHKPSGRSLEWFRSVFSIIEPQLSAGEGLRPLQEIAAAARTKSDALANWINDTKKERKSSCNDRD